MPPTLVVNELGHRLEFTPADLLRFHGPGSPGGVALAFKAMERGLPLLGPTPPRREVTVRTPFGGPGARDGFECVLRAVSDGRYVVAPALARDDLGPTRARWVFRLELARRAVTVVVRNGVIVPEFLEMLAIEHRTPAQEGCLTELKAELAARALALEAGAVFDVVV